MLCIQPVRDSLYNDYVPQILYLVSALDPTRAPVTSVIIFYFVHCLCPKVAENTGIMFVTCLNL